MIDSKEIMLLLSLLDDPDREVYQVVAEKFISQGYEIIPFLELASEKSPNPETVSRIGSIIQEIKFRNAVFNLKGWTNSGSHDLFEAALYIDQYFNSDVNWDTLSRLVETLRKDIWLELNENLTALEKVRVINHVLYDMHSFAAATESISSSPNQLLSNLFKCKKGGPFALAFLYTIVSQKLGLPIYPVNIPKNIVLAYQDRFRTPREKADPRDSILFYINPFSRGAVLGRREIEHYLDQHKIEYRTEYFMPCTNRQIVAELLKLLISNSFSISLENRATELKSLLQIVADS